MTTTNVLNDNTQLLADTNPLLFSSAWTGSPDNNLNHAEISNDTTNYKTLMIIGNRSASPITGSYLQRSVSIWDILNVNGDLVVTGNTTLKGTLTIKGPLTMPGAGLTISGLQPAPAGGNYDNVVIELSTGRLYSRD